MKKTFVYRKGFMHSFTTFFGGLLLAVGVCAIVNLSATQSLKAVEPGVQTAQTVSLHASQSFDQPEKWMESLGYDTPVDQNKFEDVNYLIFVPTDESEKNEKGFPLLLFLHGAGERGSDLNLVKTHGPPMYVEKPNKDEWRFLTVSPQCKEGMHWSPEQLLELIDYIQANYPVDPDRIYVTGLSMGGFGTWMLLAHAPERFAAAVPICGGGDPANASRFLDVPVWVYHGASDSVVPVEYSENFVKQVWALGGNKIKLTEYVGCDHGSWVFAYAEPELYKWLLQQKRTSK